MMGKRLFVVLAVVAFLSLQFADCMSAMMQDQQSMKCCGSMPCDPSNQSHDCCKAMVSSQSPSVLPSPHVSLLPPLAVLSHNLPTPENIRSLTVSRTDFVIPQYSPPELYTLHGSLLI